VKKIRPKLRQCNPDRRRVTRGLTEAWCHAGPTEGPNHRLAPWAPTWQEQGRRCSRRPPVWTFTMRRHSTVEVGRAEVCDSTVPRGPAGIVRESSYGASVP